MPHRDLRLLGTTALAPAAWGMTYLVTTELLPAGRQPEAPGLYNGDFSDMAAPQASR